MNQSLKSLFGLAQPNQNAADTPIVVGVNDLRTAQNSGTLITYGLGSCISVVAFSPAFRFAALSHYMLPHSSINPRQASVEPLMFGDTSTQQLLRTISAHGVPVLQCVFVVIGGAAAMLMKDYFSTGKRNLQTAETILSEANVLIRHKEVGGTISRTVSIDAATGQVIIRSPQMDDRVIVL